MQLLAGVGLPIDLAIARRDAFAFEVLRRIKPGETYFHNLSERWLAALRAAHKSILRPVWTEAVVRQVKVDGAHLRQQSDVTLTVCLTIVREAVWLRQLRAQKDSAACCCQCSRNKQAVNPHRRSAFGV
jgi:hypothetical protein